MTLRVITGDCLDVMPTLEPASIDAIVTDPPYGLGFMGKHWDRHVPGVAFWEAALRVAKPGAHLVAFGGTRTYHRLACAIEDAGWEIRDALMWLYGSGFPKSLDVSKAIDKAAGAERAVVGEKRAGIGRNSRGGAEFVDYEAVEAQKVVAITAPATDAAHRWNGYGTALKPAWEPIILARRPLVGTVAANVLAHGTGALNIDGCRLAFADAADQAAAAAAAAQRASHDQNAGRTAYGRFENGAASIGPYLAHMDRGRWPANVCLDEEAAAQLDFLSGDVGGGTPRDGGTPRATSFAMTSGRAIADVGGASRFFCTAKASRSEREAGLDHLPARVTNTDTPPGTLGANSPRAGANRASAARNHHPTVKPLALMQWLCRLVTPRGGVVLDPFCGSGTTGRAAVAEGFGFLGIELAEEHAAIARARIAEYFPLAREAGQ